jgi:two-component system OmpR family sensor kinase/two-component system sensor histidine kinase BaeS
MSPMRSLWIKLLLGFMLVAIVAVAVVAILANRTTTRQFEIYVSQGRQARAQQLSPLFAAYYAQVGSWDGVAEWMANLGELRIGGQGQGQGQGRGRGVTNSADRLLLVDVEGRILADSQGDLVGEQLTDTELAFGTPIEVAGQTVGTLIIPAAEGVHQLLEAEFLGQVNDSLLWAGLIAGIVALVLGGLLARQLTAPLRSLTDAAHRMAEGEEVQVQVRSQDEIGELGQAFNHMAQSLALQETLRRNLMADIAHELRTPLTVIRGDLEAFLDGVFEPTPQALASLQEETLLLSRLVDDLRALALAEAGQLKLERQPTNLVELLQGVVDSFAQQAECQGQDLGLETLPDLPLVNVDPQRVRQVVANLVSNALRHASQSGQVVVSVSQQANEVRVSVTDDGPGIAAADLAHVFDRFWQSEPARAEGSGLGLAIASELVRAHDGRIWAESTLGEGSVFLFTLPC